MTWPRWLFNKSVYLPCHCCYTPPLLQLRYIFECLEETKTIETITISFCSVCEIAPFILGGFVNENRRLKRFDFYMEGSSSISWTQFFERGLMHNTSITHLTFSEMSPIFAKELSQCITQNQLLPLESLEISFSALLKASVDLAEALMHCPTLKTLKLPASPLGSNSAEAYARLIDTSTSLTQLVLYGSHMGDDGIIQICSAAKRNSNLQTLVIGGDPYNETTMAAICDLISSNTCLEHLDISGTPIPMELKPSFEAAMRKNGRMRRCSVTFADDEDMSWDLCKVVEDRTVV
jgi:hypothetical protein